jgi:hypothetical protein
LHITNVVGLWTYFDAMVNRWNSFDQGFWIPTAIYAQPSFDSGYKYVSQAQQSFTMISALQNVENINFVSISFADSPSPTAFHPLTVRYHNDYNPNPVSMGFDTNGVYTSFSLQMLNKPVFGKWDVI